VTFLDIMVAVGLVYVSLFCAWSFACWRADRRLDSPRHTHPPRSNVRVIRDRPFDREKD
jgi:hypothetical protein